MHSFRFYSSKLQRQFHPNSKVKIFRNKNIEKKLDVKPTTQKYEHEKIKQPIQNLHNSDEYVENFFKVQMLSRNLHNQIFGNDSNKQVIYNENTLQQYVKHLSKHGINIERAKRIPDVQLHLPSLYGGNIEEHFRIIAKKQVEPYESLLMSLVNNDNMLTPPETWIFREGWTVYDPVSGSGTAIEFPEENALVLDVEVCVSDGGAPILATAVGTKYWYSWTSPRLLQPIEQLALPKQQNNFKKYSLNDLIPLGKSSPKLIVGHNVSYDRARLREQYLLEDTRTRFIDTMSLHVCVSGVTSYQRALLKSKKEPDADDEEWLAQSSLNSLIEVHRLYCKNDTTISKDIRNVFVEGSLSDICDNFQSLMSYCAGDVKATHEILRTLYPLFAERFPHPVTLAGILEISSAYLPVNSNWLRYINESDLAYEDLKIEAKYHLSRRADEACALLRKERYRENLWLWNEDWSVQNLKMKKKKTISKKSIPEVSIKTVDKNVLKMKFQHLYDMQTLLPARRPLLPGYPAWYRKLCRKPPKCTTGYTDWSPGPTEISTGMQISPKLLSLCWEGYPLYYLKEYGWGFLVPFRKENPLRSNDTNSIPVEQLIEQCPVPELIRECASAAESEYAMGTLNVELSSKLGKREYYSKSKKDHTEGRYQGTGIWCNQILEDCCYFLKLPHRSGNNHRVGNPLSKDFLNKFSENVLSSGEGESSSAARVIEIARMMSYWRNNRDRIIGQMVVWLPVDNLPAGLLSNLNANNAVEYGAICPQIVACGTLTRRATEPTWLTASNSQFERIGSELRAMVQAPPSYKIVGADVDSQELWIASVLGDAYSCGLHGATPLGWMTLSGAKSQGTDMHSVTAKAVGISRDHAKVINYARIYGAGQTFAEGLLKQFNPTFSSLEAKTKAAKMYAITKGKRIFHIRDEFKEQFGNKKFSSYEANKIALACNRNVNEMFHKSQWEGGTESAMFNRLEEIAMSETPVTPFLGCRLSRALETRNENDSRFLTTRVNWVVQSGAVDFLHLMLVSMRWLMGPHLRFCLSFHDEIRYLTKENMAYKAALSMHITNLLTRAFCSSRIGISDLPMSVGFFSSVEIDTVLRKESSMDCKTPSNPHGLKVGYGIPPGESLNVYDAIEKAGGNDITKWTWIS